MGRHVATTHDNKIVDDWVKAALYRVLTDGLAMP